jgi:hypothetical protein
LVSALLAGCDPGITIHQHPSDVHDPLCPLEVSIAPQSLLVGEQSCRLEIDILNRGKETAMISAIELKTPRRRAAYEPNGGTGAFDQTIEPGQLSSRQLTYELRAPVAAVFVRGASIEIRYAVNEREQTLSIPIDQGK